MCRYYFQIHFGLFIAQVIQCVFPVPYSNLLIAFQPNQNYPFPETPHIFFEQINNLDFVMQIAICFKLFGQIAGIDEGNYQTNNYRYFQRKSYHLLFT